MRTSRFVAAAVSIAIVAGAAGALTHGLADATSKFAVCKDTQLSFTKQSQCIDDMKSARSDVVRLEVTARYQNMIEAKIAAEQGISVPSQTATN